MTAVGYVATLGSLALVTAMAGMVTAAPALGSVSASDAVIIDLLARPDQPKYERLRDPTHLATEAVTAGRTKARRAGSIVVEPKDSAPVKATA